MENLKNMMVALVLTALTLSIASIAACQISPAGITVLSADYTLPEYESYLLQDSHTIVLQFSAPVTLSDVHLSTVDDEEQQFSEGAVYVQSAGDPDTTTQLTVDRKMERGNQYVLYAVASDRKGNSVHFSTVIQGFNDTPAQVVLSEVRTVYSNPKSEFIELYVVKPGNLAGMVLEIAYGSKLFRYLLPDVEVSAGEYVVVHLRKLADSCIDETDENLKGCSHKDASPGRDLWRNDTAKAIGNTGVILLYDRSFGTIMDALLYAESSRESWPSPVMAESAQKAVAAGRWGGGPGIDGAACADGMTVTRTLCRQNLQDLTDLPETCWSDEWIVVATSQGTPGTSNSAIAYE